MFEKNHVHIQMTKIQYNYTLNTSLQALAVALADVVAENMKSK